MFPSKPLMKQIYNYLDCSLNFLVRMTAVEAAAGKQVRHLFDQLHHEDELLHLARSGGLGGRQGLGDWPQALEANFGGLTENAALQSKVPEQGA